MTVQTVKYANKSDSAKKSVRNQLIFLLSILLDVRSAKWKDVRTVLIVLIVQCVHRFAIPLITAKHAKRMTANPVSSVQAVLFVKKSA